MYFSPCRQVEAQTQNLQNLTSEGRSRAKCLLEELSKWMTIEDDAELNVKLLFVNGRYGLALKAATKAINLAPTKRIHELRSACFEALGWVFAATRDATLMWRNFRDEMERLS
jgi:Flp pilus assembly protein TadD